MSARDSVVYAARLARIELSNADLDAFAPHLQELLAYVEKLNQLDTAGVEPTAHVVPLRNVTAADTVTPSLDRAQALQSAPRTRDGFFAIPAVIE